MKCTKCEEDLSETSFYVEKGRRKRICKKCLQLYRKEYFAKNHDKFVNYHKDRYQTNKSVLIKKNLDHRNTCHGRFIFLRNNAKDRNLNWTITEDEWNVLWGKPCTYCADPLPVLGLDRVDNLKGYMINNVVPCCKLCNQAKMDLTVSDFKNHIVKIYNQMESYIVS